VLFFLFHIFLTFLINVTKIIVMQSFSHFKIPYLAVRTMSLRPLFHKIHTIELWKKHQAFEVNEWWISSIYYRMLSNVLNSHAEHYICAPPCPTLCG